uniref:Putative secreted mucin n=1 Tax=Psorophora albipes TaxID=869069 RepID=T1D5B2_9DIPT
MGSTRLICLIFVVSALCVLVQSRPYGEYSDEDDDNENEIVENFTPVSTTTTRKVNTKPNAVETTTEYKYKEEVKPYTMKVPIVHSIRHAAGTHYYTVDPDEDSYEKLMEVYKETFEKPFSRNVPSHIPPPKD